MLDAVVPGGNGVEVAEEQLGMAALVLDGEALGAVVRAVREAASDGEGT